MLIIRINEDNKVEIILKSGYDYGLLYGIYVVYGLMMFVKIFVEKMCWFGRNYFYYD